MAAKTERQAYQVVHVDKEFEVRFYPSATLATVYAKVNSYRELSGPGFYLLLARIGLLLFGRNFDAAVIQNRIQSESVATCGV